MKKICLILVLTLGGLLLFSKSIQEKKTTELVPFTRSSGPINPGDIYSVDNIVGNMRYVPGTGPSSKSAIAVMETKVTREMWSKLVLADPSFPFDPTWDDPSSSLYLKDVSWNYSVVFANVLSIINGFTPCYYMDSSKTTPLDPATFYKLQCDLSVLLPKDWPGDLGRFIYCDFEANGYRLPRDAEWAFFCHGYYNLIGLAETLGDPSNWNGYWEHVWDAFVYMGDDNPGFAVEPSESAEAILKFGSNCDQFFNFDASNRTWYFPGFTMRLVRTIPPEITSLTSKYKDFAYYLKDSSFKVTYTANVNWMGHQPGLIRFITSKGNYDVLATGTTASKVIDMGTEFDACSTVKAVAISLDEARSSEKKADSVVCPAPAPLEKASFIATDSGSTFFYTTKNDFALDLLNGGVGADAIPSEIPLFGGNAFSLSFTPELTARATNVGKIEIRPSTANPPSASLYVVGFTYDLSQPEVTIDKQMKPDCTSGDWDGTVGLSGSVDKHITLPFSLLAVPLYLGLTFHVGSGGSLDVKDINPVQYDSGEIYVNPTVTGSLGVGVDRILSGEGWAEGGANFTLQYPQTPTLKKLSILLRAGVAATAFGYRWEKQLFDWTWDYAGASSLFPAPASFFAGPPHILSRDYLKAQSRFRRKLIQAGESIDQDGQERSTEISALQESVYPHSNPHLSSSGTKMGLVWVKDNAARSAINRTTAVSSFYSGTEWSSPQVIWDDGTADFHPRILTFSDGAAIAAWEDANKALADSAVLSDMIGSLEISATVFDPAAGRWGSGVRLTSNAYLDATPLLSGKSKSDVMLVWIANESGDLRGKAAAPNKIYFSKFDGQTWTTAALAASVSQPIFRYDLIYGEGQGYIVLSCDTDDEIKTINDRELYRLTYENGAWGPLTRLTQDAVVDDNPQLIQARNGAYLLVWTRSDGIYSSTNFDLNAKTLIVQDPYSTNLANVRISTSANGRVALTWPAPTTNSSDLMAVFYNPANQTWGTPEQLTSDKETEGEIASAFFGKNTWIGVYNRSDIVPPSRNFERDEAESTPLPPILISTDLYMIKCELSEIIVPEPIIGLSRISLCYGANAGGIQTSAQGVMISNAGTGTLSWTAKSSASWIEVTPSAGTGNGQIVISVNPVGLTAAVNSGTVTVSDPQANNSPKAISVNLNIYGTAGTLAPWGSFATPVDGATGLTGAIPVTGWVLDDIETTGVRIWRDPVAGEGSSLVFIGDAIFVEGARPDIETGYPGYPLNYRAGWGYMLLTNFLPAQGNGTYKLHAFATDKEGNQVLLGTKTITCDNPHAEKPFGTIDTPTQGGAASGNPFLNFGWVLTPMPKTVPKDGSTIDVYVDSVKVGNLATAPNVYNQYRPDVSAAFPGLNNSGGPVGAYFLDTTKYANGVHTIYWIATDDAGAADGIGSRYFNVVNTGISAASSHHREERSDMAISTMETLSNLPFFFDPVAVKRGFNLAASSESIAPDNFGSFRIEINEIDRIELDLGKGTNYRGCQVIGGELRPLPIGSTLDPTTGRFSWLPGPGFLGVYEMVFLKEDRFGLTVKIPIRVTIKPKFIKQE